MSLALYVCVLDALLGPRKLPVALNRSVSVDATTFVGKAPGEVVRRCAAANVRCVLFGGRVTQAPEGAETVALSGDPDRAGDDLRRLGADLVD